MIFQSEDDYLAHYGILRKSGRYPWGSGGTQSARNRTFLDMAEDLRKQGLSEVEVARGLGILDNRGNPSTTQLRALKSIAGNQQRMENIATAQKLKDKGLSNVAIGTRMGINESSVRNLLAPGAADKANILHNTADMLRKEVAEKTYLDVGTQSLAHIGINDTKMKTAVAMLQEEGYQLTYPKIKQQGTGEFTTLKVLIAPDTPKKSAYDNVHLVQQIQAHSDNGGRGYNLGIQPPIPISSKRIDVKYKEDGGDKQDGVIYVRPNVDDLSMGSARYAQVRIQVDKTHFLKGMAIYKDDLPPGVDLVFHTNKSNTGNKLDAMKELKRDENGNIDSVVPFGAAVRQLPKLDKHGNEINGTVRSAMNIVNDEGQWDKWSRTLSSQFLSKQSPNLAKEQLDMTFERKSNELAAIKRLTNPAVKRELLEKFADGAESSAIKLKAQSLPRQRTQVILPINSLKENEIYAPNFNHGERVVLVRHPHGGPFEIPELVVNNKNKEGITAIGSKSQQARDAVGINHKVAERLSGADFDGDTVLVIPNNAGQIKTQHALEGLKNFDPQSSFKPYDGMRTIDGGIYHEATKSVDYGGKAPSGQQKQNQMGRISNLITDMTIAGANPNELAAAVRHSMVVIDAEKHHLDYKRSAIENGIPALSKKYQVKPDGSHGGAATLISRAKQTVYVPKRRPRPAAEGGPIDRATGKRVFVPVPDKINSRTGEPIPRREKVSKLLELGSAHELSSGFRIEKIYADYSDSLRGLANEARKEWVHTRPIPISESAKKTYAHEVRSLKEKLNIARLNSPRERQAQIVADALVAQRRQANPNIDGADLKKLRGQMLEEARARTGAKKEKIEITDREWDAIQAGAVSNHQLEQILRNSNLDQIKERAMPRVPPVMTSNMQTRARSMLLLGYSQAEVAAQLGVPVSTLASSLQK